MIDSIEAVVGRHQAETASRDGRDEAMDASKFRKLLHAFSKGSASHLSGEGGGLQDLMSALMVEPLPVNKTPRQQKKEEVAEGEGDTHEQSALPVPEQTDQDVVDKGNNTSPIQVEVVKVREREPQVEEKQGSNELVSEVVKPQCNLQPMARDSGSSTVFSDDNAAPLSPVDEVAPAGLVLPDSGEVTTSQVVENPVAVNSLAVNEHIVSKEFAKVANETSVDTVEDEVNEVHLDEIQQASVQPESSTELVVKTSSSEITQETSKREVKAESFTNENSAPVEPLESLALSDDRTSLVASGDPASNDEVEAFNTENQSKAIPGDTSSDLPVVEGLLQLRALIERVSKEGNGVSQSLAGKQAELVHSIEGAQDAGLNALSATKESPVSKAVPNVVLEKSNRDLNVTKEKTTAIPERIIPKMMEKLEQVAREVERSKDGRSISLRLDPPQLGKVRVDMTMKDGSIHTRLSAESDLVAHFLRERGDELQALIRKVLPHLDQATISFGESSTSNHFGQQMDFGGDSFNGFHNNGGRGGDAGSDFISVNKTRMKEPGHRSDVSGDSEHWVA